MSLKSLLVRFLCRFKPVRDLAEECERLNGELADSEAASDKLRSELRVATSERDRLASEAAYWKTRAEDWEGRYTAAIQDSMKCREAITDYLSLLRFGRTVFGRINDSDLPEQTQAPQPVLKTRVQGRYAQKQQESDFLKSIEDFKTRAAKQQ